MSAGRDQARGVMSIGSTHARLRAPSATAPSPTEASNVDQTLLAGFTRAAAGKARDLYRTVLGLVLIVEAATGLALIAMPARVAHSTGYAANSPWIRPLGGAVLVIALLFWLGRREPSRAKLVNLLGIFSRPVLALILVMAGGPLRWAGMAEFVAALVLSQFYFKYFEAEVMSRP
jgi:hypothetical protein